MKKISFVLQAVGIILVLPLYVFLELNHQPSTLPSLDSVPGFSPNSTKNVSKAIPKNFDGSEPQHPVMIILKDF